MVNDETLGALLLGGRPPVALPVIENAAPASSKVHGTHQLFLILEVHAKFSLGSTLSITDHKMIFFVFDIR